MTPPDDLTRFFDELHAAPTRRTAETVFSGADWLFLYMDPKERELAYARIDDIIREKPED